MTPEIEVQEMGPEPAAVIRFAAPVSQIGEQVGRIFGEVMSYLQSAGIPPVGPPFTVYPDMEADADGNWHAISGFPVARAVVGNGRVEPYEWPGGDKVVVATHVGPYDALEHTYNAIRSWMQEHNLESAGPMKESYLSDPDQQPDPSEWRTVIFCPAA
ncbi:effector-binding domain-containing protein [Nakamurella panacisegetis]|uniref:Effector-binding domain-containing protein n=1 Tax=Nakamurella panacisegetis TaxID=1090615 RepID=A0A1H0HDB2_9ACTN|nr:GyrI-like domain-containing protein [Nakamurella panacisegetis]SDO17070.1 effector-binding domain-containing protein [Nakamurella panacisegetis]